MAGRMDLLFSLSLMEVRKDLKGVWCGVVCGVVSVVGR